jgi:hypothetical protein
MGIFFVLWGLFWAPSGAILTFCSNPHKSHFSNENQVKIHLSITHKRKLFFKNIVAD